jgi:ribose 5-phosphate isomerase A
MSSALEALAARALELVPDGCRLGLGSGRTASFFIRKLAERVRQGLRVRAVPTSETTARLAQTLGIPLDSLDAEEPLDLTIDGADEVQPDTLDALKGWGGALLRERVVAAASRRQVLLITADKLVPRLGTRGKLPVEVLPFAAPFCQRKIAALPIPGGLRPVRREQAGQPVVTDNGNWILDCGLAPQDNPVALERALRSIPGVLDTGLFLGTASLVLVAEEKGVRELHRHAAR